MKSNAKIQISKPMTKIQSTKNLVYHLNFELDLTFGLRNLDFSNG